MNFTDKLYQQAQKNINNQTKTRQEETFHKCAYPSCQEKARYDSYCWEHFQNERYTGR